MTFIVPEILFSEEDYAAATALQEADEGRTDDEHDDTRALAGMLAPPSEFYRILVLLYIGSPFPDSLSIRFVIYAVMGRSR